MAADLTDRVAGARSLLFVPGDRPERFDKALASGADLVVVDLEDAVAAADKPAAREALGEWLGRQPGGVAVRVNAVGTPWHAEDLEVVSGHDVAVMVPRATLESVRSVVDALGDRHPVVALVETAAGVLDVRATAALPGVVRLALGTFDLADELGVDPDDRDAMLAARGALVLASAAAGLAAPVDGVTAAVDDPDVLASDLAYAARLGLRGKLCIHPRQVSGVAALLRPTDAQVAWARRVVAISDAGDAAAVSVVDGQMVDRPVVERARRILASFPEPT